MSKRRSEADERPLGKYSHQETLNFPLVKTYKGQSKTLKNGRKLFLVLPIKDALLEEGGSKKNKNFDEQICLKLDEYYRFLGRAQSEAGVDIVFCLENGKALMTEAKMEVAGCNFTPKLKKDLDEKMKDSVEILGKSQTERSTLVVLVAPSCKPQALQRFAMYNNGNISPKYKIITEREFYQEFFSEE
ncbi:MAG: hypothetical protein IJO06_08085 [Thermoguttaceae bacterium]|nr:hypothetical protein [Thermoguttaceae bacterium]